MTVRIKSAIAGLAALALAAVAARAQEAPLYQFQSGSETRWSSPENLTGAKGAGGRENRGQKGHAFETIPAGKSLVLADIEGAGVIDRMWMTFDDRSPEMLRSLRLEIYYDGAATPAVSAPLGDFFGHGAGELVRMDTAFIASPEARSFVATIPMPFRRGARVLVVNESAQELSPIYYDINYRLLDRLPADGLYFHAYWSRDRATTPGQAFKVLPRVRGRGRFLGSVITTFTNPIYEKTWWGEGEAKIYLDGDGPHASLVGTGAEDYIGTAWGQGAYINRFQGAPVADETRGRWSFYRFHVPDPIFFARDVSMEMQQIGGAPKREVLRLLEKGVKLTPISVDAGSRTNFRQLLATGTKLDAPDMIDGHTNFLRSDDVSAVAYFYLDRPASGLPPIAPLAERTAALRPPAPPEERRPEPRNPQQ